MIDVEQLKARTDLASVVAHYSPLQKRGQEFVGKCVWHSPDNHPSMYVVPNKGIVHCFACGASEDVIGFIQHVEGCDFQKACELLGATDDWHPAISDPPHVEQPNRITSRPPDGVPAPDMALRGLGPPTVAWAYHDAGGTVIGYVARYDTAGGKEIRCWTWGARGNEPPGWSCGHWNRPRPLYNLHLLADRPETPVVVVEGEKAADAATKLLPAYVVTTWPGGAKAWYVADWTPLRGRKVLLWPDADAPGVEAMTRLAAMLGDPAGLGCEVAAIDTEGMPEGFDAADWTEDTAALIAWARPRKRAAGPEPAKPAIAPDELPATQTGDEPPPAPAMAEQRPAEPATATPRRRPRLTVVGTDSAAAAALDPEAVVLPQALSDDALADYFAAQYGDTLKFVPEWSSMDRPTWFQWHQNDGWRRDILERYFTLAMDVTRRACYWPEAASLSPRERRSMNSTGKAASFLAAARRDERMATRRDLWDADQWLLGVPGGAVDLRTGDLREPTPTDYITRHCAVAPAPGPHPLFDRVLARASSGSADMAAYLWRWFGYVLTGDTREECFLFLHGQGGSGKSTLTKALGDILGDYAVSCKMETFAETHAPKHAEELARMDGARLALTSETDEGQRWNESRIKWLTGRNKITANFMRSNSFEFTPRFKLLIEGNHRPGLKSVGEEMRRRIHLVEYAGTIPEAERDKSLKDKLQAEYPAILHSMIAGCLEWQRVGLAPPDAIRSAVNDYLESEDTIGAWLDECCDLIAEAPIMASAAYKSFRTWAEAHGEYCPSQKRFSQKLSDRGFTHKRSKAGSLFVGLRLKLPDLPRNDFD